MNLDSCSLKDGLKVIVFISVLINCFYKVLYVNPFHANPFIFPLINLNKHAFALA